MAKAPKPKAAGRPVKHPGAVDSQGRTGKQLSLRLDPELVGLLPAFILEFKKRHDVRLSKTDVLEKGLRAIYREYGLLPPDAVDPKS